MDAVPTLESTQISYKRLREPYLITEARETAQFALEIVTSTESTPDLRCEALELLDYCILVMRTYK